MNLPIKGCVSVSVTDNVLDEKDWSTNYLILRDGIVTRQTESTKGVYRIPNMKGWTREQIIEWTKHDDTGRHPEQYHKIDICL